MILIIFVLVLILFGLIYLAVRLVKLEDKALEKYIAEKRRAAYYFIAEEFRIASHNVDTVQKSVRKKFSNLTSGFKLNCQ